MCGKCKSSESLYTQFSILLFSPKKLLMATLLIFLNSFKVTMLFNESFGKKKLLYFGAQMSTYNDAAVIAKAYNKVFLDNYYYYYFFFVYNILIGTF